MAVSMTYTPVSVETLKTIFSTAVTCILVFIGYSNWKRKSGIRFRAGYVTTATVQCDDHYVSRVWLENLKDRAVTIFGLYLKLGCNTFVVIEEFGDEPLILRPFETCQRDYQPLEFYSISSKRVRINKLLNDPAIAKRLVVSTSSGKYTVRRYFYRWNPVHTFFRNHLTAIVRPIRSEFKGKAYGANALFLVELKLGDGSEQLVPIYRGDDRIRRFRNVQLNPESLESRAALEAAVDAARRTGKLQARSACVYDLQAMRNELFEPALEPTRDVQNVGMFAYYVLGTLRSWISNWKIGRFSKKQTALWRRRKHNRGS